MAGKVGHRGWGRIRQLPSKRFQANYVGPDLVRHNALSTFGTRMDAEYWLSGERRLIERDEWTAPKVRAAARAVKSVTVGEYAKKWVAQRTVKPRTRSMYESLLRLHITPVLGEVPVRNLTADAVRAWFAGLDSTKVRRNSHAYGLLHAVCATAVTDGVIGANPCNLVGVMNPPRKRDPVILSVQEVAALAAAIRPERLRVLVLLSAWCGLRWGEVIEVRRKDIAADCVRVLVSRAVTHRGGCRIDTPKSGKGRAVVVPPHVRDDLRRHLSVHVGAGKDALLFPAVQGGCHLNDKVFRDYFQSALKVIGREEVRVHDLRHFAGTQTARVGNLVETMQRLGHSTARASLMYQGIAAGRDHEIADALSQLAASEP